jgi:type II secretory pathway pseudopilin PulG
MKVRPNGPSAGFSLLEVMMAAGVLALGIASSIIVLQRGLQALDTARNLTGATQVMQSEMERLRLLNWAQMEQLEQSHDTWVPIDNAAAGTGLTCTREISDYKAEMKQIVLTASWRGVDGRSHSARMITRYGKNGLNDYFYTVH